MSDHSLPSAAAIFEQQLLEARILRRINSAAATLEPTHVLDVLCAEITKALGADSAGFGRLSPDQHSLEIIAEYNPSGKSALGWVISLAENAQTFKAIQERRPIVVQDLTAPSASVASNRAAQVFGIQSMMIVPIIGGDSVIGTLGVDSHTPRDFSLADQNLAMNLVMAAIPVLKQSRMIETLRREIADREVVEQALRTSQNRFVDLVNNLDGIVFEGEISNGFPQLTFVSQGAQNMFGYPVEQWFSEEKWFISTVHYDDQPRILEALRYSAKFLTPYNQQYRMRCLNGKFLWIHVQATLDKIDDVSYWRGLITNITTMKNQQLLEQNRNKALEFMAQGAPLETILTTIADLLYQQMGFPCGITAYNDGVVHLKAQAAIPDIALPFLETIVLEESAAQMRQFLRQGKPFAFPLTDTTLFAPELRQVLLQSALNYATLLPMRLSNGAVRGGMVLFSKTPLSDALDPRITSSCDLAAIAIERQRLLLSLEYQALHDQLTGLPNRALYNDRIEQAIARANRDQTCFALLHIDLNHFKTINDTYGHAAGDIVLISVARVFENTVRASDTVARLGGDEFCIIAPDIRTPEMATILLEKLKAVIHAIYIPEMPILLSASMGYAIFPTDASTADGLYRAADRAMYVEKGL